MTKPAGKSWRVDRDKFTLEWCQAHWNISSHEVARMMGVAPRTARRYFDELGVKRFMQHGGWHKSYECDKNCPWRAGCDPNGAEDTKCMKEWSTELEDILEAEQKVG